jgi:hypothetical protein
MRIPPRFLTHLLVRGVAIWLLTRLGALLVMEVMLAIGGSAVQMSDIAVSPGATIVVVAALVLTDLHRRKETLLLRNLGVTTSHAVLVGSIPALLIEGARAVVVA